MNKKKRNRPSLTCKGRLSELKHKHSVLDAQIDRLPAGDPQQKDLKKQKLRLKDDIARIERTQIIEHLTGESLSVSATGEIPTLKRPVVTPCDRGAWEVAAE